MRTLLLHALGIWNSVASCFVFNSQFTANFVVVVSFFFGNHRTRQHSSVEMKKEKKKRKTRPFHIKTSDKINKGIYLSNINFGENQLTEREWARCRWKKGIVKANKYPRWKHERKCRRFDMWDKVSQRRIFRAHNAVFRYSAQVLKG